MNKDNKDKKSKKDSKKESKDLTVKKEKRVDTRKWFKETSLTILLIAIIVATCIGINIFVENVNLEDIDFTEDKIHSLSEETRQITENIDKEVEIILIKMSESEEELANRYRSINDKISVEVVNDITARTDLVDEYNISANGYGILVKSGEKYKILTSNDLYTYDYATYTRIDTREEALTNAIIDVTTEEKPVVYNLIGHNKYSSDYFYLFLTDLVDEAYDVYDLDLLTRGEIPEDCSVLIMTTLAEDLTATEKDEILDYINEGGKILYFTDPNSTGKEMPNLQTILDEYGISISEGVVLEQDMDKMLYGTSSAILVTVSPYTSVTNKADMNLSACFMTSGRIDFEDSEKLEELGVEVETLASTSSDSFYRTDYSITDSSKTDTDEDAAYSTVGALLKKKIDNDTTSEMIVYTNNIFISNLLIAISQQDQRYALDFYNNEDLAMNSVAYLTERENMILIRKDAEISTYAVTEQQNLIILSIIFAIPVLIVIIGIIVWQVRRRKK